MDGIIDITNASEADATKSEDMAIDEAGGDLPIVKHRSGFSDNVSDNMCTIYGGTRLAADELRILFLQPAGEETEDINCRLVTISPRTKPAYEALSYTWGENIDRRIIYVNGQPFTITTNLYVALRYLRKTEEARILWIDAICIDQSSVSEKTHQVGMMRDIYRNASEVLMWLEESDGDIRKAMAFLKERKRFQLLTEDELDPVRPGLIKLFERPWWSRIWVVQEFLVATKPPLLGCGHDWLPWEDVEVGMMNLKRQQIPGANAESYLKNPMAFRDLGFMSSPTAKAGYNVEAVRDAWSTRKQSWSLEHLLAATYSRNTTQPHDKVFSLLGLTPGYVMEEVPIDYDRPYTDSYQRAMLYILRRNMGFLINAMHRPKADDIPSWCVDFLTPDWSNYATTCGWYRSMGTGTEDPESHPQFMVLHSPSQSTIEVLGTFMGCIDYVHVSKCAPPNLTPSEKARYSGIYKTERPDAELQKFLHRQYDRLVEDFNNFYELAQASLVNCFSPDEVLEIFSSGIRQDLYLGELAMYRRELLTYNYPALHERAQADFERYGHSLSYRRLGLIAAILENLIDKTLFSMDSGNLGQAATAVDTIMKGDMVCFIEGCHVPVILRWYASKAAYKIITFSWIPFPGISYPEQEEMYRSMDEHSQTIKLC